MFVATRALQPMPQRDGPPQSCNAQYDNQMKKIFYKNVMEVKNTIFFPSISEFGAKGYPTHCNPIHGPGFLCEHNYPVKFIENIISRFSTSILGQ
jgi:hypothetical protein